MSMVDVMPTGRGRGICTQARLEACNRHIGKRSEGVEKDWPYIFTDLEFEPMIEARFAAIKQGFDQIRGRNPKR
jgi:hypothetical protein